MARPATHPALSSETPIEPVAESETSRFTAALAKGKEEAWAAFHDRYRPRLLAYLTHVWHGEPAHLDDLLQETLLRSVRHMRVFPNEDVLWSWLTVLARSAAADHGRRRSRRWRFLQCWRLEAELRSIPAAPDPFAQQVDTALARLDDESRALLKAKYYHRRSVRDIAHERNTTEKAIEGRLARARRQLRKLVKRSDSP